MNNRLTDATKTDWYPGAVKPVRRGLYERWFTGDSYRVRFSYWNGRFWGGWALVAESAMRNRKGESAKQEIPWRGLAKKP